MKYFFSIILVLVVIQLSYAQYYYDRSKNPDKAQTDKKVGRDFDHYFSLSWDITRPTSNTSFIDQQSSIGTKLGFRKRINDVDRLWVGGDLSWSVFKQYVPYNTYYSSGSATSTDFYNYSYCYALSANLDYLFLPTEKVIVPYGALGLGLIYNKVVQYYNVYGSENDKLGVMIRPEVGVLIGFGENASWRMKVAAHLDFATTSISDFRYNIYQVGLQNFTGYGFQIGLVKMAW